MWIVFRLQLRERPIMDSAPRHVLVTGGSRGLGLAIVRSLVYRGYLVTSISRSIGEDLQALRTKVPERLFAYEYDVRNIGNGQQLVRKVEQVGALYALVNNAGIANDDLLIRLSETKIRETLEVNLIAAILLSRAVAKRLVRARTGRIVECFVHRRTARRPWALGIFGDQGGY